MMLLHARDNNNQSFAFIWLLKENQNEFLKHPKIKFSDALGICSDFFHAAR